ncbi:MAG: hypothetical protein ACQES9_11300 [Myxococcota bacterium]
MAFLNEGKLYALDKPEKLKLKYGKRTVKIKLQQGDEVVEKVIELDNKNAGELLKEIMEKEEVLTIHTEEASLENIFIEMTGRGLTGRGLDK